MKTKCRDQNYKCKRNLETDCKGAMKYDWIFLLEQGHKTKCTYDKQQYIQINLKFNIQLPISANLKKKKLQLFGLNSYPAFMRNDMYF